MRDPEPIIPTPRKTNLILVLVAAGYACVLISLVYFPLVFCFLAFSFGIFLLSSRESGHGFAIIVLSVMATLLRKDTGVKAVTDPRYKRSGLPHLTQSTPSLTLGVRPNEQITPRIWTNPNE